MNVSKNVNEFHNLRVICEIIIYELPNEGEVACEYYEFAKFVFIKILL